MGMRTFFLLASSMLLAWSAEAQFSKTIHNSIEADSAQTIAVDLAGEVVVEPWAGNTVLVETQVRLYNATKGVFEYFVERAGRYDVLHELSGSQLRIYSKDAERKVIQTKHGQSTEEVAVRVMIPRDFAGAAGGPYTRQPADSDL